MPDQRADTYLFLFFVSNNTSHRTRLWDGVNSGVGAGVLWGFLRRCPASLGTAELEEVSVGDGMIRPPAQDGSVRCWLGLLGCCSVFCETV